MNTAPIFVVGSGRCGTTVLGRSLGRHTGILSLPNEPKIFGDFASNSYGGLGDLIYHADNQVAIEAIIQRIKGPIFKRYLGRYKDYVGLYSFVEEHHFAMSVDALFDDIIARRELPPKRIAQFLRDLYAPTLLVHRARRWCDDTPVNVHYIREIVDSFTDAKIIHIIRDGRDVADSFLRLNWARTFPQALSIWYSRVKIGQTLGQAVPLGNYLEIGFEELITKKSQVFERILSFIDEEWEEQVLDLVREGRANRHERQFGNAENRLFEALARDLIDEFGWQL